MNDERKDPRCPHCGKPVLQYGIYGLEGTYHPACTQPDPSTLPNYIPQQHYIQPGYIQEQPYTRPLYLPWIIR